MIVGNIVLPNQNHFTIGLPSKFKKWNGYEVLRALCTSPPSGLSIHLRVYSVYTPGRHWIAYLSPSNLPDASDRCDQTVTYIEQAMCRNQ